MDYRAGQQASTPIGGIAKYRPSHCAKEFCANRGIVSENTGADLVVAEVMIRFFSGHT
jgi:hypothetical protein